MQLVEFAKTEYDKDFEVNFAEEIIADDDTPVRGKIEGKQIWLDVHHSRMDKELLFYYGLGSFFVYLTKLGLIEGEQYFVALLHEIGHAYMGPDDSQANVWAENEFKKKSEIIRKRVTSVQENH